jgi:hypothetical protein
VTIKICLICIFVPMHLPICGKIMMQIVISLEVYGVKSILGIQYGFKGFVDKNHPPIMVSFPKCFMIKENVWCIYDKITFLFKPCKFLLWLGVGGVCVWGWNSWLKNLCKPSTCPEVAFLVFLEVVHLWKISSINLRSSCTFFLNFIYYLFYVSKTCASS